MGYNNTATLNVINIPTKSDNVKLCPQCKNIEDLHVNFCPHDGTPMEPHMNHYRVKNIVALFIEESEVASYSLQSDGKSSGEGYSHIETLVEDLQKFSIKYPDGIFKIEITWDQGFGGDAPTRYYVQNGKVQKCIPIITYEEFDKTKLV